MSKKKRSIKFKVIKDSFTERTIEIVQGDTVNDEKYSKERNIRENQEAIQKIDADRRLNKVINDAHGSYKEKEKTAQDREKGNKNSSQIRTKKKESNKEHFLKYWKQRNTFKTDAENMAQYRKSYPSRAKSDRQFYRYIE